MRAAVYRGANDLRLEEVPVPAIEPNELLVKVAACGVCPTDIKKIQYGTVPPPRIFGHETAGTIVRVAGRVRRFKPGDRVALHHHVPCLKCHACRHRAFAQCDQYKQTGITAGFEPAGGGYAEYVRVMPFVLAGVVPIPPRNSFLEGAMLEPVNTVLKAVNRLALLPGDTVLVAGQGPIGLMFTRLLALKRMRVLANDLLESRLQLAREFGAETVFQPGTLPRHAKVSRRLPARTQPGLALSPKRPSPAVLGEGAPPKSQGLPHGSAPELAALVDRLTRGRGLDAAVLAVPSEPLLREAQGLIRGGGQLLLFSNTRRGDQASLDLASICVDEKDMIGSYSADFLLQPEVARLVFSRRLDTRRLITHQFPLDQTAAAVDLAAHPKPDSLKIVVVPTCRP